MSDENETTETKPPTRGEQLKIKSKTIRSKVNRRTAAELAVKPINKTALYTVSPNYKPLKKLEIGPPKPYFKHPDDNSWRNESISSLGIVFNPKNSSKPLTEVLKNKTETELVKITEKDNSTDVPDLRERLDKLAEQRKSKKPKIEQVEEFESFPRFTSEIPPARSSSAVRKLANVATTTPKQNLEEKRERQQKLLSKLLEYYDSSEEKNADSEYATLPDIDIKKSSETEANTETPWLPQSTRSYIGDRQPTLQYFPPLTTRRPHAKTKIEKHPPNNRQHFHNAIRSTTAAPPTSLVDDEVTKQMSRGIPTSFVRNLNRAVLITHPQPYKSREITKDSSTPYIVENYKALVDVSPRTIGAQRFTSVPHEEVTVNEVPTSVSSQNPDYEVFERTVLNRFVENMHRTTLDQFPVLVNSSVDHGALDGRLRASSSTFLKQMRGQTTPETAEISPGSPNERFLDYDYDYTNEEKVPSPTLAYP